MGAPQSESWIGQSWKLAFGDTSFGNESTSRYVDESNVKSPAGCICFELPKRDLPESESQLTLYPSSKGPSAE
jgi:hypothetical protein